MLIRTKTVNGSLFTTPILGIIPSTYIKISHLTFLAYKNAGSATEFTLLSLPNNSILCIEED